MASLEFFFGLETSSKSCLVPRQVRHELVRNERILLSVLTYSALIRIIEADGSTAVIPNSAVLLYSNEIRPPRTIVIARYVRC